MRMFIGTLLLCAPLLLLGAAAHAATEKPALYDVQTRHYSSGKTVMISSPHLGDKPTVDYWSDGAATPDVGLHVYEFVGPWVVDVDWQAHHSIPKVTITPR